MQKGKYDSKYNTGGRAKGKKKKIREIKGKELQLIRGNWLFIQYQKSKRRNMSEKKKNEKQKECTKNIEGMQ